MIGSFVIDLFLLVALSLSSPPQSHFPQFDSWLEKYRAAKIADPVESEARMQKGFQELLAAGNPSAAERALSLACFRFAADPRQEKEQYAAQQPWTAREKAIELLGKFRDPLTLRWLTTDVLLAKTTRSETERLAAARALGIAGHEPSLLGLLTALGDDSSEVRAAAANAAGRVGGARASLAIASRLREDAEAAVRVRCLDALAATFDRRDSRFSHFDLERIVVSAANALGDPDWRVRVAAADFFAQHPEPKAMPALIQALRQELRTLAQGTGRKRAFFSSLDALVSAAGRTISTNDPEAWAVWWEKNRDGYTLPTRTAVAEAPPGIPYYFGIPVRSDRMVFLLDISGSMDAAGSASKLARAKQELIGALEKLAPTDRFNVVLFENAIYPVFEAPSPATPANIALARQRVLGANAGGGTNLFGALETGLRIAQPGGGARFGTDADTVFLLSDGTPSTGLVTDPNAILAAIASANSYSRVAIHTIGFASDEASAESGEAWMQSLSSRNFGEHRKIPLR